MLYRIGVIYMDEKLLPGPPLPTKMVFSTWSDFNWGRSEDMHMHTTYVDGSHDVATMAQTSADQGIQRILFTEHIRAASTYFPEFAAEIRAVEPGVIEAYVGVETKILGFDGLLDISPEFAMACDAIVASVHRPPPELSNGAIRWAGLGRSYARKLEFELSMAIVEKSQAPILGHPMGMYIGAFDDVPKEELAALARACRDNGKTFELNARYCPDPKLWKEIVCDVGCLITISSDAHSPEELGSGWKIFSMLACD